MVIGTEGAYQVRCIACRVCGEDRPQWLGVRGNREYSGAPPLPPGEPPMVTNVVRCRACGFVYTNPLIVLPERDDRQRYHDAQAYVAYASDPEEAWRRKFALLERIAPDRGRLLDVGAGKGEFLAAAARRGWDAVGIEPSADFVRHARETPGLEMIQGVLDDRSFEPERFDAVTLNMVLEHVDDPHALLRAVRRVLKLGGAVLIEVPNLDSVMLSAIRGYFRLRGRDWSPLLSPLHWPYHSYGYTARPLAALAARHGFRIVETRAVDLEARGFREHAGISRWEAALRRSAMRLGGALGRGDVLLAAWEKVAVEVRAASAEPVPIGRLAAAGVGTV